MKSFFKMTLATVVGLILFSIISTFIGFMFLGAIAASADTKISLEPNAVYELNLSGSIVDRVESEEYAQLMSVVYGQEPTISLEDLRQNIREAAKNGQIKGIYIKDSGVSAAPATIQALRNLLLEFKESGKFIVAYADNYSSSGYWLASVADKVYMNPSGNLALLGINMQTVFYKETLEKIGVQMQIFRVGTYKSAVEPYTETHMSQANRLQMHTLADGIWGQLKEHVSETREISQDKIQSFADVCGYLKPASLTVEYGLIDSLCYEMAMDSILKDLVGAEPEMYSHAQMNKVQKTKVTKGERIAVLYASGTIDGTGEGAMKSSDIVEELNKLAKDDKIKAVVLRVNSPGGSAFGSEQMWHAAEMLKTKKPLVVSMGDYAASGGYYMSCNADKIIAEPTTLTGSIGIFGMFPNVQGLVSKIGLNFDHVSTATYADFGDITRPMTESEKAIMQSYIENGYDLFVKRCAEGRGLSTDSIKVIAQGRVWLGEDALRIGLVDELGGLDRAIEAAAELAELETYSIRSYPVKKDLMTKLMEDLKMSASVSLLKSQLGENYRYLDALNQSQTCIGVQARLPYCIYFE